MSEFHRIVTYLYLYENNEKTRNVGYAKIENKDTQCRVEIHMKNTGFIAKDIPVYFYLQNADTFSGILLGLVTFAHGTGEFKKVLDSNNLVDSGYPISSIKGIFLPFSEKEMILSQWDDDTFQRAAFLPLEVPDSPKTPISDTDTNTDTNTDTDTDTNTDTDTDLQAAEAAPALSSETSPSNTPSLRWDFIMENFSPVTPFSPEDTFDWVQLELKDLRLLPNSYWHLGNNSFLLHGFFNYHHLILGRKENASSHQYILGIPGVFQYPERVMATIFGFPEFRSTSQNTHKPGQFGYWLRPLD